MNWFYAADGQQKGPVSDMDFTMLTREGTITGDTLVWREGLPDWQPLSIIRPDLIPVATGTPLIQGMPVLEQNKDLLVQQMREGALPATFTAANPLGVKYAGFWIRVAAKLIDGILLYVVNLGVSTLMLGTPFPAMDPSQTADSQAVLAFWGAMSGFLVVSTGIQILYNAFMVFKWGSTLGKMAVGIKVVRADAMPVSLGRSIGRAFADVLNGFICGLTYLMPAFDEPQKRALHDHICDTRVIYK